MVLAARGGGVDGEVPAYRAAVAVEQLADRAPARAVGAADVLPDDDVAAVGQGRDLRELLRAARGRVDTHLVADGHASPGVALRIDAGAATVLAGAGPGDDVAAVGQHRHLGVLLRAFAVGVDAAQALAIDQRCAVQAGRDVDRHGIRGRAAAVAIGDAQAHRAAEGRALRRAAVGEALHHGLHGLDTGVDVEIDAQRAAVAAGQPGGQGADGHTAVADGAAGHADLPRAVADVAHAQLVAGLAALHVEQVESAAVEVGRVGVHQGHGGVDQLRGRIDEVLGEGDATGEIAQHGAGLPRQRGRVAEELLRDAVGVVAAVTRGRIVGVSDDEAAAGEPGDGRLVLGAVRARQQLALAVDGHAGVGELAHEHIRRRAGVGAVAVPADHEAAAGQPGDGWLVLAAGRGFVDEEFAAHLGASGVEDLRVHAGAGAVLVVAAPGDDEAAVGQQGHRGLVLVADRGGVDDEGVAEGAGGGVVQPAEDAQAGAVVAAGVLPDDDEVAVGIGRHVGQLLRAGLGTASHHADACFCRDEGAGVVVALEVDVEAAAARLAGRPHHREPTGIAGHGIVVLGAGAGGVHQELPAHGQAIGVVALAVDAPAAGVVGAVLPGDDPAPAARAGEPGDMGVVLRAACGTVDTDLTAHRHAHGVVALHVDAVAVAILPRGGPHDDVAAVGQHPDLGLVLGVGVVGVDDFLAPHQRLAIQLARDVDGDQAGVGAATVAVAQAQAHGACRGRALRGAGVGQALHQGLHGLYRGTRAEVDAQVAATAAVA